MSVRPFRPFDPKPAVPILGQAFTVQSGFPTTLVTCGCEAKTPVLLVGTSPGSCPACRRVFVVQDFSFTGQTGQVQVSLRLGQLTDQPEPAGVPS